jgi:hypothetical protein
VWGQSVKEEVLDMPRGDGRGPAGFGPMTGRSAGFCAGYGVPGYANPGVGGGAGARGARCFYGGGGFGRGYRRMYYATGQPGWMRFGRPEWGPAAGAYGPDYGSPYAGPMPADATRPSREEEMAFLEREAGLLREELDTIQARLSDLSGSGEGAEE